MEYLSKSVLQTQNIAKQFAKTLKKGDIVLLNGEMGAGKTVFVKGVAKALGITAQITSPTYAYMNDYDGILYHYDCYRLSSGEDAEGLGLTDYFYADGICIIEWAQNIRRMHRKVEPGLRPFWIDCAAQPIKLKFLWLI